MTSCFVEPLNVSTKATSEEVKMMKEKMMTALTERKSKANQQTTEPSVETPESIIDSSESDDEEYVKEHNCYDFCSSFIFYLVFLIFLPSV